MVKPSRVDVDWEAIEAGYRCGVLSIREIAKTHGLSDGAVRKRAKRDGWDRDLTAKVNAKVRSELVRTEVRTEVRIQDAVSERAMVEAAATQIITLVREHRGQIGRNRALVDKLMAQLELAADNRDLLEGIIDEVENCATGASTQRHAALMKAVSLSTHAGVLKNLADTLKTVIGLEREAFNVTAATSEPVPTDSDEVRFDRLLAKIKARPKVIDVTPTD
ncbi:MAG TPA: hypothetical protein VGR65_03940 [Casimicrobiaceae bacterium]|nr:hypothetical protein [Casimicrobiaceae bacterium]